MENDDKSKSMTGLKITRENTIQDFGDQFTKHDSLGGFWGSDSMFRDHFGDIFDPVQIKDKLVAEVGSGSGRILRMISNYKPKHIFAIEPSKSIEVAKRNLKDFDNITFLNVPGDKFILDNDEEGADYIFSLGVIHHIKNPKDVLINIHRSLKKNGKFIIWVYGHENNEPYVFLYKLLSVFTKRMNDNALDIFSNLLNIILAPYIFLCRYIKLPLRDYLLKVFGKCSFRHRKYIIFDQLNPAYAKYYKKDELINELKAANFTIDKCYHRHNYSWTVVCTK